MSVSTTRIASSSTRGKLSREGGGGRRLRALLSALLAIAISWTVPLYPSQAHAAQNTSTDRFGVTWTFSVNGNDATLESLSAPNGVPDDLVLPATVSDGAATYPVTAIADEAGAVGFDSTTIPASVTSVGANSLPIAADGMKLFFLGAAPSLGGSASSWSDVFQYGYPQIMSLPEDISGWDDAVSEGGYDDVQTFDVPVGVSIRKDGASVDAIDLAPGATAQLAAVNEPESATFEPFHAAILWSSDNASVSVSKDGAVSVVADAKAGAAATVTAINGIGLQDTVEVRVVENGGGLPDTPTVAGWKYQPTADGQAATIVGYDGSSTGALAVPARIAGLAVTSIADGAFSQVPDGVTAIDVPDSVKQVGAGAFSAPVLSSVGFMGSAPSFAKAAGTFSSSATVSCFPEDVSSFEGALGSATKVKASDREWSSYVEYAKDGVATGVLGTTDSSVAFHGKSDPSRDLTLPDSFDGVPLSVLGEYALYGDLESLSFSIVRVPASYTTIDDFALLDLDSLVVFEGACPTKVGDSTVVGGGLDIEIWYPASEKTTWSACDWANPNGSYDDAWTATLAGEEPVLVGYRGSGSNVIVPSSFYGRTLARISDAKIDGDGVTSLTIPASISRIDGQVATNLSCDVVFQGEPPAADDVAAAFRGANGGDYAGTLRCPLSLSAEWQASIWAKAYRVAGNVASNPEDFTYEQVDGGLAVTGYTGDDADIAIPAAVDVTVGGIAYQGSVVAIADGAFENNFTVTGVQVPSSVKSIGKNGFWKAANLRSVQLPEGLESIGDNAFWYDSHLTEIDLPASLTNIGDAPFISSALTAINVASGSSSFSSVDGVLFNADRTRLVCYPMGRSDASYDVPTSVKVIGREAFRGESSDRDNALSHVNLPDGLEKIEWAAFRNAEGLSSIVIPDSVKTLETYAFDSCGNLESVTFPAGIEEIPDGTLSFDSKVVSVVIPEGVKRIGDEAFRLTSVSSIDLPEGLTEIKANAFDGCAKLERVSLPSTLTTIGDNAFTGCDVLSALDLESTAVTTIGNGALSGMKSLKSIVVPNTVTSLGRSAFMEDYALEQVTFEEPCQLDALPVQAFSHDTALRTVVIPASMNDVGYDAFYMCTQLQSVVFQNQGAWTIDKDSFTYAAAGVTFYGYMSSSTKDNLPVTYRFRPIDVVDDEPLAAVTDAVVGQPVDLSVKAKTLNGTLSYRWVKDGDPIEGAEGSTYRFTPDAPGVYRFSVQIANSYDPLHPRTESGYVRVSQPAPAITFTDVPEGMWYHDVVYEAAARGIVTGYTDENGQLTGIFDPDRVATRAQVLAMLSRVAGADVDDWADTEVPFTDVDPNVYYMNTLRWAYANGVIFGDSSTNGTTVRPDEPASREEVAAIAARIAAMLGDDVDGASHDALHALGDWQTADAWATGVLAWATDRGVITVRVVEGGSALLDPHTNATRAEVAKMSMATLEAVSGPESAEAK